ncbi:hypothetical protein BJF78_21825 [Pseudonocardia sp. CNS-139]|nr:hypothetical protein BJF78_21825 [Pseudonocardia sp. CNS-139]
MDPAGHRSLGALVRRHRTALGLTQEELAEAAGISARSLSDMERGITRTARRHTTAALADALRLSGEARRAFEDTARGRPAAAPAVPDAGALVGRDADLAAALGLLRTGGARLLTITGAGGVGKTSLATALVAAAGGDFADGAAFVPLADVRDPALVLPAVVEALGLRTGGPPADALAAHLADRDLLLVLDNMEQLTDAAPAVAELVARCPALRTVVTSRVALRVTPERELPLGPLALPVGSEPSPAAALFLERCAVVRPGGGPGPRTGRRSRRSAAASTGCRSRSSSPRPGCACSRPRSCSPGSPAGSPC